MRATGQGADSDLGSKLNAMSDPEELAAHVAAIRTFVFYQQLGLFFTLIEKDVIAAERVFTFNRMNAEILRTTAAKTMFALAAVLVVENGVADEDVPGLLRATLAAIRPQISGPIAEDADRVLAASEGATAA
jgi:hypothetical protein